MEQRTDLARIHHAGLIAIGLETDARGSCPGSTAYAVISSAAVPVLSVPAPTTDCEAGLEEAGVVAMQEHHDSSRPNSVLSMSNVGTEVVTPRREAALSYGQHGTRGLAHDVVDR
jgi:hypothetical protein